MIMSDEKISNSEFRLRASAADSVMLIRGVLKFRKKLVTDFRRKSKQLDKLATASQAFRVTGLGLVILTPLISNNNVPAITGAAFVFGATLLDTIISKSYKDKIRDKLDDDRMKVSTLSDKVCLLNSYLIHFIKLEAVQNDAKEYVIEAVRLTGIKYFDPKDYEPRELVISLFVSRCTDILCGGDRALKFAQISLWLGMNGMVYLCRNFPGIRGLLPSLRDLGKRTYAQIVATYKGGCYILADDTDSILRSVYSHYPGLYKMYKELHDRGKHVPPPFKYNYIIS